MAYVPLVICTVSAWDDVLRDRSQVLARVAVTAVALLAAWQGFPSRLKHAFLHPAPDHRKMEEFVRAAVVPEDKAYADFEPYYPMRRGTTYVLLPTYAKMMSPKEKSEITVLVVRAPNRAEATTLVGGSWKETAALDLPEPYDLRVLRRQ
jgi:hypothetical protein